MINVIPWSDVEKVLDRKLSDEAKQYLTDEWYAFCLYPTNYSNLNDIINEVLDERFPVKMPCKIAHVPLNESHEVLNYLGSIGIDPDIFISFLFDVDAEKRRDVEEWCKSHKVSKESA